MSSGCNTCGAPKARSVNADQNVGSVVVSPRLGPIALALVRREAAAGDSLVVGDGEVRAEVVDLAFAQA